MTSRLKSADSRSAISELARVIDLEVVELARRSVAAEVGGIGVLDPGPLEQRRDLGAVLLAQLLLDAVGAEAGDRTAHVDPGLVDRVAEGVAGVAAHEQAPLLRHERAHVPDGSAHDDVDALHRDPAAR